MLSSHLRKFKNIYDKYGIGAVKNLWLMTSLLTIGRTVNLNKLKDYVGGILGNETSDPASHYRRLTRFFVDYGENKDFLADIMRQNLRLLKNMGFKTLVMDGTSWSLGATKFHYLVLSVLVGKVAVPIYWVQLEKIGASSQAERQTMFEQAMKLFDLEGMTLLADREYVGKKWFEFLKNHKIHFVIRLRFGDYVADVDKCAGNDYQRMYQKCAKKNKIIKKQVLLEGISYQIVMMPNPKPAAKEPVFIFMTTLTDASKAAQLYVKRWKIECLFFHLKSNGYHLEDLNLKSTGKTLLMMAIVATAYILAIKEGLKHEKSIALKSYADGSKWPETSIFRKGIAWVTPICANFLLFLNHVFKAISTKFNPFFQNVQ